MLLTDQHPLNKSIMASVVGVPNVGKSSLVNYLMGMDLSVVTNKPQTTRNKFHCVFTVDRTEIILVDTPGMHKSNKEFNKRLNQQANEGVDGVDLNLFLVDINREIFSQINEFNDNLDREMTKTWLIFTKSDRIANVESLPLQEIFSKAQELMPCLEKYFVVSSTVGDNIHLLTGAICDCAAGGPHLYNEGRVSNKHERFFVTEYIREQVFNNIKEEVPYEVAVVIDEFEDLREKRVKEKNPTTISSKISASILVNKPSQRGILVGTKGSMIKKIGIGARERIEGLIGGQVHLNLHVKVSENWQKNNFVLEDIGLPRAHNSNRVWRKK